MDLWEKVKPVRPMKYPYTITAKMVQFPYKLYWNQSWLFRFGLFGIILSMPLFYKITKMSQTPENIKKWEEIRKKDFGGPHLH